MPKFIQIALMLMLVPNGLARAESGSSKCPPGAIFDIKKMRASDPGRIVDRIRNVEYPEKEGKLSDIWDQKIRRKKTSNMEAAIIYELVRENGMIYDPEVFHAMTEAEQLNNLVGDDEIPHLHAARLFALREGTMPFNGPHIYGQLYFFKLIGNDNFSAYLERYLEKAEAYMDPQFRNQWRDRSSDEWVKRPRDWAMKVTKRLCECNSIDFHKPKEW